MELAPFTVVDLGVTVRPFGREAIVGAAAVELSVHNVLAAEYEVAHGFPAPGRVILVGVRVGE